MEKNSKYYQKQMGKGVGWRRYLHTIYLLQIIPNKDFGFGEFVLKSESSEVKGNTVKQLITAIDNIITADNLVVKNSNSKDTVMIFVDDFDKIRAFIPSKHLEEDSCNRFICFKEVVEFREWDRLVPTNTKEEDVFNVLMIWQKLFIENKTPYLTLAQYPRKKMLNEYYAKELMPENDTQLKIMYQGLHSGVLYSDYTPIIERPMIGADIVSAYIHSIAYKKHCMTTPTKTDPSKWEEYLRSNVQGSIGLYTITYECNHEAIKCYKQYVSTTNYNVDKDQPSLELGQHTVKIVLCDIDLVTLQDFEDFKIINIECNALYTWRKGYLPDCIRYYCVNQFIQKNTLKKGSLEQLLYKQVLNSGFFGNFLYEAKSYISGRMKLKYGQYKAVSHACPLWGIYTCAYVRNTIITLGQQLDGWHYSDTDSIYCDYTPNNVRLVEEYNDQIINYNESLTELLRYTPEQCKYSYKLGQFVFDNLITKFRFFNYKQYAYKTINNDIVVKCSGCSHKDYDDSIFTDPNFRFKYILLRKKWSKNYYCVRRIIVD